MLAFNLPYRKISMLFGTVFARIFRILLDNKYHFGVMITAGLMLLSCWMPWVTPHYEFGEREMGYVMLGPGDTGWHGSLNLMGATIPNWATGCCAGVIAVISLVEFKGIVRVPGLIPLLLALYGLFHTSAIIVELLHHNPIRSYAGGYRQGMSYQSLGIGIILAFACFLVLSIISNRPLQVGVYRVYDLCRMSLVWSRFRTSYIQVIGIITKRRLSFTIIFLAFAAFICFLIIFYFNETLLATLWLRNTTEKICDYSGISFYTTHQRTPVVSLIQLTT